MTDTMRNLIPTLLALLLTVGMATVAIYIATRTTHFYWWQVGDTVSVPGSQRVASTNELQECGIEYGGSVKIIAIDSGLMLVSYEPPPPHNWTIVVKSAPQDCQAGAQFIMDAQGLNEFAKIAVRSKALRERQSAFTRLNDISAAMGVQEQ